MDTVSPTGEEIKFNSDEIIVSKTDKTGRILYANDVFCRVAEMSTSDVVGQQHSLIRHPDMPRAIFKLLWDAVQSGNEIFAYIKNMSKTGKYYWVLAHVTPCYDTYRQISGYHSNRRAVTPEVIKEIEALYKDLRQIERSTPNRKEGLSASMKHLYDMLEQRGQSYSQFIWSVGASHGVRT